MSALLNIPRDSVCCELMEVWEWCDTEGHFDKMSRDCHVYGVTLSFLVTLTGVTGFDDALKLCGWVTEGEDGHPIFPKLGRWVGKSAKERLCANERQKRHRDSVTEMSRQSCDKNVTRVEESREDIGIPPLSPKGETKNGFPSCFELWWERYPAIRRTGKKKAYADYQRAGKALIARGMTKDQAAGFLQNRCIEYACSPLGQSKFACNPSRWLAQGMYDDDPQSWNRKDDSNATHQHDPRGNIAVANKRIAEILAQPERPGAIDASCSGNVGGLLSPNYGRDASGL